MYANVAAQPAALRILHVESPNLGGQGDHVYRTLQPCRALGELDDVWVASGSLLSPAVHPALAVADVLVVCDVVDADLLPVIAARRRAGLPTVYEINDHFRAPQPWNATAYLASNLITRGLSAQLAARADANQFTVPQLARDFAGLNPEKLVFPNQLWHVPALRAPRPPHDAAGTVWLGWGGSLGHREDLAWVMPVLQRALARHPQVGLAIMGPPALRPLFAWAPAARFRFVPGGPLERYHDFLDTLDVGICPLLPTAFNRCRSDVKFLELAAHGVAAVCSALPPYQDSVRTGDNGLTFETLDQLAAALDRLLTDADLRRTLAARAHAGVAAARREQPHAQDRLRAYRALAAEARARAGTPASASASATTAPAAAAAAATAPAAPPATAAWPSPRDWPAPYRGSRYQPLHASDVEVLLHEGLTLAQAGRPEEAARAHREAARRAPGFHVPPLLLGSVEPDPRRALAALHEAVALAPGSPAAALLLGTRLEQSGDLPGARQALERCRSLCPELGAAEARLGALAEQAGDTAAALAHYQAATAANPYFVQPALRLALLALDRGDPAAAVAHTEAALAHDGELWTLRFVLGRAYLAAGRAEAARAELERALPDASEPGPVLAQLAKVHAARGDLDAARVVVEQLGRLAARPGAAPA
jgi:hypothetical protein